MLFNTIGVLLIHVSYAHAHIVYIYPDFFAQDAILCHGRSKDSRILWRPARNDEGFMVLIVLFWDGLWSTRVVEGSAPPIPLQKDFAEAKANRIGNGLCMIFMISSRFQEDHQFQGPSRHTTYAKGPKRNRMPLLATKECQGLALLPRGRAPYEF